MKLLITAIAVLLTAAGPSGGSVKGGAEERLTLANAVMDKDPAGAERVARDGLAAFPTTTGFHLLIGRSFELRHRPLEAWCEYQWELLRAGSEGEAGHDAVAGIARLMDDDPPGPAKDVTQAMDGLALVGKDPARAVTLFRELSTRAGKPFALQLFLVEAQQASGDTDNAIAGYRALLALDPNFVPAYVQLSELLRAKGDAKEADLLLAKARSIDPANWSLAPQQ